MLGRTISHYRIVSQLGAGGMGVVYGAEDVRLGRPVAVKFVHDELACDRHAMERFQFEARAASALNHPNICTIYDIGEDQGHPFIVMELMKGQTLRDRLASGSLKVHQIVDVGIQVADALDAAHGQGIVHRDIKPANIFLNDRGQAKVLDFGLAKLSFRHGGPDLESTTAAPVDRLTGPAVTMGTVEYMSPEQVAGDALDARTDLFSIGVVLYECATGHRPFTGNTSGVILAAILNRAPVAPVVLKPDLPLRLQEIINNCLEKDRELRYQTAADLRADLKRARRDLESGHSGGLRRADAPPSDSRRRGDGVDVSPHGHEPPLMPKVPEAVMTSESVPARRGRVGRWVLGASVVAALLAVGGSYWLWKRPVVQPATVARPPVSAGAATREASPPKTQPLEPVHPAPGADTPPVAPPKEPLPGPRPTSGRGPAPRVLLPPAAAPRASSAIPSEALPDVAASPPVAPPAVAPVPSPASPATPPAAPPAPPEHGAPAAPTDDRRAHEASTTAPSPAEDDDAAIRRVVIAYGRAIETKDLSLFRSVKPNLSREEERRIQESFRAVSTQRVSLTVLSIDRRGLDARVRVRRRDTLEAGGRTQTTETEQLLTLGRTGSGWILVAIGQ